MDLVAALLAFARLGEVDWAAPNAVGWFIYDFSDAVIVSVPEWRAAGFKRGRCGKTVLAVLHS